MVWDNLKKHISEMRSSERTFSGFEFRYKNFDCIGILSIVESDLEISKYGIAKIYVYKNQDLNNCLVVYPSWTDMSISPNITAFYNFFEIETSYNGDHFKELKARFMSDTDSFISPNFQPDLAHAIERASIHTLISNDPNDPNKRYCIGLKLNGNKKNGNRKKRSDYNDEKSRNLKKRLYAIVGKHKEISFNYSKNIEEEKDDWEILRRFIENNSEYGFLNYQKK
ncbi:DUF6037 family protein [Enterococcus mundtii]|uniref:DUF6037 family protein n=1 Tax=Enterococcus mundtii TaxID=53346 RepID=UPI000E06E982|nr:DUF6037 family protein [Enterococcus mundtii]STD26298.1 Uncharacterised protein [Enterococcus mundtii]